MRGFSRTMFLVAAAAMASVSLPAMMLPSAPFYSRETRRKQAPRALRFRRLNRSRHWEPAASYKHARHISPVPHIPVR